MLAYFLSEDAPGLRDLLATQRRNRIERAGEIADRLAALGAPLDVAPLLEGAAKGGGKSLARPQIARGGSAARKPLKPQMATRTGPRSSTSRPSRGWTSTSLGPILENRRGWLEPVASSDTAWRVR